MTSTINLEFHDTGDLQRRPKLLRQQLSAREVLEKLKDPQYQLSMRQETPPLGLVKFLSSNIQEDRKTGPKIWNKPGFVKKISPYLIVDGVHQGLIDGYACEWISGFAKLRDWVSARQLNLDGSQVSVFHRLVQIRDEHVHQRRNEVFTDSFLSSDLMRMNRLVEPRGHPGAVSLTQLSEAEYEFVQTVDVLKDGIGMAVSRAISNGEVIGVESMRTTDKFLSHKELSTLHESTRTSPGLLLMPTANLNSEWLKDLLLDSKTNKKAQVKQARICIENLYAWGQKYDRRAAKDDCRISLRKMISISGESFDLAWKQAKCPDWKESGRLLKGEKIESSEINELINRGEVECPIPDYFD